MHKAFQVIVSFGNTIPRAVWYTYRNLEDAKRAVETAKSKGYHDAHIETIQRRDPEDFPKDEGQGTGRRPDKKRSHRRGREVHDLRGEPPDSARR